MARTRKRFIAGAECPACGAQDTLQLTIVTDAQGDAHEEVKCVACGHKFTEREAKAEKQDVAKDKNDGSIIGLFKP
ncbi:DNA-binding protein [Pseudidiomarina insulisalsae]|uniref:DNA-binding protein n=2 Tax=Pseudidiomarina insulisalsae TaxID=575789 RepID=A0A432YQ60_9GAMM|nr:DNA-binding protein [Pseudidiomarina insulisalsae]